MAGAVPRGAPFWCVFHGLLKHPPPGVLGVRHVVFLGYFLGFTDLKPISGLWPFEATKDPLEALGTAFGSVFGRKRKTNHEVK